MKYVYIRRNTVTPYNKAWRRHESKRKKTPEQIKAEISVLDFFAHQSLLLRKAMQLTEEFLKTFLSRCLIPREIPRETESSGRAEK